MKNQIDAEQARQDILEAVRKIKSEAGYVETKDGTAPQFAHDILDGMLSAKVATSPSDELTLKAAPGWAHALLDFLWDLF